MSLRSPSLIITTFYNPFCALNFQDVPRVRELQELQAVLRAAAPHHGPAPPEAVGRVQEVLRRRGHGRDAGSKDRRGGGGEGTQAGHGVLRVLLTLWQNKFMNLVFSKVFMPLVFEIFLRIHLIRVTDSFAGSEFWTTFISVSHMFIFAFFFDVIVIVDVMSMSALPASKFCNFCVTRNCNPKVHWQIRVLIRKISLSMHSGL